MLTQEQEEKLQSILDRAEGNPNLSNFHRGFLYGDEKSREKGFKSINESFEEFGTTMRISDKQWRILNEIDEKLL